MTVIGRAVHPALFQQFTQQVKTTFPQLERVQFVNVGKLQTPATIANDLLLEVVTIYDRLITAADNMEKVARIDNNIRERAARYNRAVIRNANRGFGGRRAQQAFTK